MSEVNIEQPIKSKVVLDFEKIIEESESIRTLAKWLLLVAGIIFIYLLFDLVFIHALFEKIDDKYLSAFGAVAAGTSGVIVAASTTVFFIYNIRIQNASLQISIIEVQNSIKEMNDSNMNFLSQKRENLLFNLIENHNKLIVNYGSEKVEQLYNTITKNVDDYLGYLDDKRFPTYLDTEKNPLNQVEQHEFLKLTTENICHIIKFIDENFDKKSHLNKFYHQTFNTSMNSCVKLGLFVLYSNGKLDKDFQLPEYYKFERENVYKRTMIELNAIPIIKIGCPAFRKQFSIDEKLNGLEHLNKLFLILIETKQNYSNEQLLIINYSIKSLNKDFICEDDFITIEAPITQSGAVFKIENSIVEKVNAYAKLMTAQDYKEGIENIPIEATIIFNYKGAPVWKAFNIKFSFLIQLIPDYTENVKVNYILR